MADSTEAHYEMEEPLNAIIKYLYCIQTPADFVTKSQHLAPNLEMMLIFNFGAQVRASLSNEPFQDLKLERVGIIGPLRKMLNYEVLPNTDLIIAVFNPNGFYRLFQKPVDEIGNDGIIDPDSLLNISGFDELWKTLKSLTSLTDRIEMLKEYTRAFMHDADEATASLIGGIPHFHNPAVQPVRAIAMESDLSERTIQLRFQKYMGFSPKELLRFLRFKQVINDLQKQDNTEVDWHDLVSRHGYHDQSHLIKDFRMYLGATPQKFIRDILGKEFCISKPGKYDG